MQAPARSAAYKEYLALLLQLDHLMRAGQGDSLEADALRDRMDGPWYRLSEEEHHLVGEASADLYTIWDAEFYPHAPDAGFIDPVLAQQVEAAESKGDAFGVLELLRTCSQQISLFFGALLRGGAYLELGMPEVAARFFQFAVEVETKLDAAPPDPRLSFWGLDYPGVRQLAMRTVRDSVVP